MLFINAYYKYAPYISNFLYQRDYAKKIVKSLLNFINKFIR